jgi:site-specific DNA recombinase
MLENRGKTGGCAIYTRQSRTRGGVSSSCELQRGICADFATEHGWQVIDNQFDDVGESSETLQRPALQRLLQEIAAERIDRVVVYSIDRLTRKLADLHRLLALFEQHETVLSVVTDPHFGQSAANRLTSNIVAAAAEFQQEMTRERMADARAALKRKGRRVAGRVPYGYLADPRTKQLTIHRKQASHIRKMFELAVDGRLPKEIAEVANKRGWRVGGGELWTPRQVLKVLSNPTYAGWIRSGSGILPGQHDAIVSNELFETVRRVIESRRTHAPRRRSSQIAWPLRGVLKCGRCGRSMSPSVSGYKNVWYRYYRCRSNAGGRPPCRGVCAPAFEIERFVRTSISSDSWQGLTPSQVEKAERFAVVWRELDEGSQSNRLATVVREVVFDPDEGTITVTLVDDAVDKAGCTTRE